VRFAASLQKSQATVFLLLAGEVLRRRTCLFENLKINYAYFWWFYFKSYPLPSLGEPNRLSTTI